MICAQFQILTFLSNVFRPVSRPTGFLLVVEGRQAGAQCLASHYLVSTIDAIIYKLHALVIDTDQLHFAIEIIAHNPPNLPKQTNIQLQRTT